MSAGVPPSPLPACPSPRASEGLPPRAGLLREGKGQLPWKPAGKLGERLLASEGGERSRAGGLEPLGGPRGREEKGRKARGWEQPEGRAEQ